MIKIKDIKTVAELELLVGEDIDKRIIGKSYKGKKYYRKRAYSIEGEFENGGKWYAGVMIHKGKLLGIKYPNEINLEKEWDKV